MKPRKAILLLAALCYSSLSFAQYESSVVQEQAAVVQVKEGLRIFGGVGTGYGSILGQDDLSSPRGADFQLTGHLAYQLRHWAFEVGMGWSYTNVSGVDADGNSERIRIRNGVAD